MPKLDHFGFLAPYYDSLSEPKKPEKLCSLIGCPPDGRILDAGGGTGRVAQFLVSPTNQVIVADQSMKMLQQTKSKNRLRPACSLTEALPFEDATFDRIIMVDAFHHVKEPAANMPGVMAHIKTWREDCHPGAGYCQVRCQIGCSRGKVSLYAQSHTTGLKNFFALY